MAAPWVARRTRRRRRWRRGWRRARSERAGGLSWSAASDNVGVTGYEVERCQGSGCPAFAVVTTVTSLSWSDTGRLPGTSYSYRVRARDGRERGGYSSVASAATPSAPDNPPAAPTGLGPRHRGRAGSLSWTAATDDLGVAAYEVERCRARVHWVRAGGHHGLDVVRRQGVGGVDELLVSGPGPGHGNNAGRIRTPPGVTDGAPPPPPTTLWSRPTRSTRARGPWPRTSLGTGTRERCRGGWPRREERAALQLQRSNSLVRVPGGVARSDAGVTSRRGSYPRRAGRWSRGRVQGGRTHLLTRGVDQMPCRPAVGGTIGGAVPTVSRRARCRLSAWSHPR